MMTPEIKALMTACSMSALLAPLRKWHGPL
jgi:hypothetical protein